MQGRRADRRAIVAKMRTARCARWQVATFSACATALLATVGDASQFAGGREMAASFGLTPKQNSSGGKARLLGISKRGDAYLRSLLVQKRSNVNPLQRPRLEASGSFQAKRIKSEGTFASKLRY